MQNDWAFSESTVTLRDLVAVHVAAAYISKHGYNDDIPEQAARAAYLVADAMLKERLKD